MDRITLVCTSHNTDYLLLKRMASSAKAFDEMIIHYNGTGGDYFKQDVFAGRWEDSKEYSIPVAYNKLIAMSETEWICCFCDDDYFYPEALQKMLDELHKGIDADVAHFKFHVSGYTPPQDKRALLFGKEYDLCEKQPITPRLLNKHNRLPAGSFFRKSAWQKAGGFQGDKMHDWDLWKRMSEKNCTFKYFDHCVYNFVRRENSAWIKQNTE